MKIVELIRYSRCTVRGRRSRILLNCLFPLSVELFFLTAEAAVYSFLLYFGGIRPMELFTGKSGAQLVFAAVFAALRLLIMPPLWCGAVVRVTELIRGSGRQTPMSDMLLSGRFLRRSIGSGIFSRLISSAVLMPTVLLGKTAVTLIIRGGDDKQLFIAVNSAVLCLIFFGLWVSLRISLRAVPFVLAYLPEIGGFAAVMYSLRCMSGRRRVIFKLVGIYFLPLITVLPAIYFIPEAAAALSLGMWQCINEYEEEKRGKADVCGGGGKAGPAGKISPWRMRRLRRAASTDEKP